MKKLVSFLLLAVCLLSTLLLAGCGPKCQHVYTHLESTTATCTAAGVETYVCDDCGETTETKEVEAYGHHYNVSATNNYKCKTCDLLMFNVTVENLPETITVYHQKNSSSGTPKVAELKVNGYSWGFKNGYLELNLNVTIEQLTSGQTNFYPKFAYSVTSELVNGDFVVKNQYGDVGETITISEGIYLGSGSLDYTKQYNFEFSIYEEFTFQRDPDNPLNVQNFISGTFASAE